jgi:hypothetical protein
MPVCPRLTLHFGKGEAAMLTDAFVPLFSYPEETAGEALPQLTQLLEEFASRVAYCWAKLGISKAAGTILGRSGNTLPFGIEPAE